MIIFAEKDVTLTCLAGKIRCPLICHGGTHDWGRLETIRDSILHRRNLQQLNSVEIAKTDSLQEHRKLLIREGDPARGGAEVKDVPQPLVASVTGHIL